MRWRFLFSVFLPLIFYSKLQSQEKGKTNPIPVARLAGPIKIDGFVTEPAWQSIQPISFFLLQPVYGAAPTEKSELLITYDDKHLYVAARLFYHDSAAIIGRNYVRDGWRGDDWFGFDIDTRNDKQNALRFALYPFGTHYDMAISNDAVPLGNSTINTNYNLIWEGKCALTKEGWFLEMKIPFAALPFKPQGAQTIMNISATRQSYHSNELQHFPQVPQTIVDAARKPSLKQPFVFENIKPSKLLYITPSVSAGITKTNILNEEKTKYTIASKNQFKPSIDIKYSISPQIIADLTANTDFSQAEVDDQQFNLSRFSLFYPEKRLFFQEQAGMFEFKLGSLSQLFYSRVIGLKDGQIAPVIGGLRLTGKVGKTDIGFINMATASTNINDSIRIGAENFTVLRTRNKVWNQSSYIGTMLTTKINRQNTNIAAGADAVIKLKGEHYFLGAVANSYYKASVSSFLKSARLNLVWDLRKQDKLFYTWQYNYSGKDFNPGIGFVDRSNFHNLAGLLSWGKFARERKGVFRYKKIAFNNESYWNASDGKQESFLSYLAFSGHTFKDHYFNLRVQGNYEYLKAPLFFGKDLYVNPGKYFFLQTIAAYEAPAYLKIRFPFGLSYGKFYDGSRMSLSASPSWSINKFFELKTRYNVEYLKFKKRDVSSFVHLASLKLAWAFNLHLSGEMQAQYNTSVNKILANGRVRYHFSDGRDLYIVYNQIYFAERFKETPALPVYEQQQFLIKYMYTFH
jgi:hypothetical protein